MTREARANKLTRRNWLLAGLGAPLLGGLGVSAASLVVRHDGDLLFVSAPEFHFISGKSLERLRDGASVVFLSQLSISLDAHKTVFRRAPERFVVSYDVWEEKFSVTRLGGKQRKVNWLSAYAAEAWCVESMSISATGLAADRQFWVRLEMRAADPRDEAGVVGEPGINLTRLIEIFSRPARTQQPPMVLESGPLRLADLRKVETRASRSE